MRRQRKKNEKKEDLEYKTVIIKMGFTILKDLAGLLIVLLGGGSIFTLFSGGSENNQSTVNPEPVQEQIVEDNKNDELYNLKLEQLETASQEDLKEILDYGFEGFGKSFAEAVNTNNYSELDDYAGSSYLGKLKETAVKWNLAKDKIKERNVKTEIILPIKETEEVYFNGKQYEVLVNQYYDFGETIEQVCGRGYIVDYKINKTQRGYLEIDFKIIDSPDPGESTSLDSSNWPTTFYKNTCEIN